MSRIEFIIRERENDIELISLIHMIFLLSLFFFILDYEKTLNYDEEICLVYKFYSFFFNFYFIIIVIKLNWRFRRRRKRRRIRRRRTSKNK